MVHQVALLAVIEPPIAARRWHARAVNQVVVPLAPRAVGRAAAPAAAARHAHVVLLLEAIQAPAAVEVAATPEAQAALVWAVVTHVAC